MSLTEIIDEVKGTRGNNHHTNYNQEDLPPNNVSEIRNERESVACIGRKVEEGCLSTH